MKKALFVTIPTILGIFMIIFGGIGVYVVAKHGDFCEVNEMLDGIYNDVRAKHKR